MQLSRHLSVRARGGLVVAVTTAAVAITPLSIAPAHAAASQPVRHLVTAECTAAQTALARARAQQHAAKAALAKARAAVHHARAAHKAALAKTAQKRAARLLKRVQALGTTAASLAGSAASACAAPSSAARANGAGRKLALLAEAKGLPIGTIDATQLTTLLNRLLPGLAGSLSPGQSAALLAGFNALGAGPVDPSEVLGLLSDAFTPDQIAALLGGTAGVELITALCEGILGDLSGLVDGFPVPGSFDPTNLDDTFAGMFGDLNPTQFGDLLVLLTRATGTSGSTFSLEQLTAMLDTLAPGATAAFSPSDLTTMLAVLNGHAASEALLANLLGGQFTPQQLSSVMGGSAPAALVGAVFAQVMAQFATAGAGGLQLPSGIDPAALAALVTTVTQLFGALTGGGEIPVICGFVPLPGLCP